MTRRSRRRGSVWIAPAGTPPPMPHPELAHRQHDPMLYERTMQAALELGRQQVEREQRFVALFRPPAPGARVPRPEPCRGCGDVDLEGERHRYGVRTCCPDCDHRPRELEPEPIDDGPDERDEHDAWHPWWVEGCDGCVDRANELEQQRVTRVDSDAP